MSITAFKKKGVIRFGSNVSGKKPPGGVWLRQGPFGAGAHFNLEDQTGLGFSINGGIRTGRYIGQNMMMSKNGTPFRGIHPLGSGGVGGTYPRVEPTLNVGPAYVDITGNQAKYIKQSTLSTGGVLLPTGGMLEKKYMWVRNGQYPNYWVQPDDNLPYNPSQWVYVQNKAAANDCVVDVNNEDKYIGNIKLCTSTNYPLSRTTYFAKSNNGAYTKQIHIAQTSSQRTLRVQRKCANPKGPIKPFPFAANNDSSGGSGTTNRIPPPIAAVYYLEPPEWYTL